jgi:redox-sensitive bicupin YhaK (pirin superfamily)
MPTHEIQHLDPFLFINHHGPQVYGPDNQGLPFGPHPHRGFETLTLIYDGDIMHWDSGGSQSIIHKGGIQWMTAGSGLIHSEISSEAFKKSGGNLEIIQLWMNLPARFKSLPPKYQGFEEDQLPVVDGDGYKITVISGEIFGVKGPVESITGLTMTTVTLQGSLSLMVDSEDEVLFYVVEGTLTINNEQASTHDLVVFTMGEGRLEIEAQDTSRIIIGFGKPYNEPIVAQGPFVMNSEMEIHQAYADFQAGKM